MKIKVKPEDFIVREEPALTLRRRPDRFAVFHLTKSQWDTFDLIDLLARRLGVPRADISYGGIKDRFALTEQLISVRRRGRGTSCGPATTLEEKSFSLSFAGYSAEAMSARRIRGNRFSIVLRDLEEPLLPRLREGVESARRWGVPNYFDEQRFGSARHGLGFMGKEIFLGRRKQALRLYFQPSGHDDRKTRALKTCVTEHWGQWAECLPLAFGGYRRLLEYLEEHKGAYRRALSLIDRRFLVFVLNAYQSYLFNEILAATVGRLAQVHGLGLREHRYRWGTFLFYDTLPQGLYASLRRRLLPVPGYDSVVQEEETRRVMAEVLAREGIRLEELRVRQLSRLSVHGVQRPMLLAPQGLSVEETAPDELYPGKVKLRLAFFLPRGGYATILLKRLFAATRR